MAALNKKGLEKLIKEQGLSEAQIRAVVDQIKNSEYKPRGAVEHFWSENHVKVGIMSDLHIGSKYTDYGALEDLLKRFEREGVEAVYIVGDMTEGYNRRKGHSFECDLHGSDAQADGVIERMPEIGKDMYFILGDHDHWHYENGGADVGQRIEAGRPDLHSLGFFSARVQLSPYVSMDLTHPDKGTAYALSYHPQKMIEALSGGEKPNILLIGHYHKIEQLFYRNIHSFQAGCIQGQTPWMKRNNLSAHKGGWILDIHLGMDGVDRLDSTLIPYY